MCGPVTRYGRVEPSSRRRGRRSWTAPGPRTMSVSPSCRLIRAMESEGFGTVCVPFETILTGETIRTEDGQRQAIRPLLAPPAGATRGTSTVPLSVKYEMPDARRHVGAGRGVEVAHAENPRYRFDPLVVGLRLLRLASPRGDDLSRESRRRDHGIAACEGRNGLVQRLRSIVDRDSSGRYDRVGRRGRGSYGHLRRCLVERKLRLRFESALHPGRRARGHGTRQAARPRLRVRTRHGDLGRGYAHVPLQDPPRTIVLSHLQ